MYPAEFGGKASALINVVTKSGSNAFHGSALEFVRNDGSTRTTYFDDPDQRRCRRSTSTSSASTSAAPQAGSDVLLLQLRRPAIRKAQTQTFSVPTAALRSGDFSGLPRVCDPVDPHGRSAPARRFRQPDSDESPGPRRARTARPGAAADERRQRPEPAVHGRRSEPDEPVQSQARSSLRRERHALRPLHVVPRATTRSRLARRR